MIKTNETHELAITIEDVHPNGTPDTFTLGKHDVNFSSYYGAAQAKYSREDILSFAVEVIRHYEPFWHINTGDDETCCGIDDCGCHTLTKDEVADYLFDDEPSPILGSPILEKRLTELEEILKAITTRRMFLKDMTYDQIVSLHGADYAASWLARED